MASSDTTELESGHIDNFTDETSAAFVIGRLGHATLGAIREAGPALTALSEAADAQLSIIAHGDFSEDPDDDQEVAFVVGIVIGSNEAYEPAALDYTAMRRAAKRLRALEQDAWESAIDAGLALDEDEKIRPWLVTFGPLSCARVAFAREQAAEGLERIRGVAPGQEPQEKAVYGVELGMASYDDGPVAIRLNTEKHEELERTVGSAGQGAGYWLVASYDY